MQAAVSCVPYNWNGGLVIYAHGYVPPLPDPNIYGFEDGIPERERQALATGVTGLLLQGYAFATTTYSEKGYAIPQAEKDLHNLVKYFNKQYRQADQVLLVGASEGGLITAMQVERHPRIGDQGWYDGGLAMCGPVDGMPYQVEYLGNFRVLFDYFFPGVLPGSVDDVPENAWMNWDPGYTSQIALSIQSNPAGTFALFNMTGAAHTADPPTYVTTSIGTLFYSIWATNNLQDLANGNPYSTDSLFAMYPILQDVIPAVEADPRAEAYIRRYYMTTGDLQVPLVTMHNLQDPVVPYSHETAYAARVTTGMLFPYPLPIFSDYGHCDFTPAEFVNAFGYLVSLTTPGP